VVRGGEFNRRRAPHEAPLGEMFDYFDQIAVTGRLLEGVARKIRLIRLQGPVFGRSCSRKSINSFVRGGFLEELLEKVD